MTETNSILDKERQEEKKMRAIIQAGMRNPMVRRVAIELASALFNEVGVPLARSGARRAYKGIARKSNKGNL